MQVTLDAVKVLYALGAGTRRDFVIPDVEKQNNKTKQNKTKQNKTKQNLCYLHLCSHSSSRITFQFFVCNSHSPISATST
jgi:hypothetical protein